MSEEGTSAFERLGVSSRWVAALRRLGISAPTPIQESAYPILISGQSAVLQAETGTGKTLTYLVPVMEAVAKRLDDHARELASAGLQTDDGFTNFTEDGVESDDRPNASPRMTPAALVLVPTVELAQQVAAVAASLMPEAAGMIRAVYGSNGLPRRETAALIVATPRALREHVNFHHLANLSVLVLDEADMLLSGHYLPDVQGYVLATFKQRPPHARPQHIFVAATLPSKGKESAGAFLDRYYAEPEVARVSTSGVHRQLRVLRQVFLQVDAALPPTTSESEAALRLRRRMASAAQDVYAQEQDGDAPAAGDGGDSDAAAVDVVLRTNDIDGGGSSDSATDSDSSAVGAMSGDDGGEGSGPLPDVLADRMAERLQEDRSAGMKAENETRAGKLVSLRRHALLEALLLPASDADATQLAGPLGATPASDSSALDQGSSFDAGSVGSVDPLALTRKKHRKGVTSLLGLSDGAGHRPKAQGKVVGAGAAAAPQQLPPPPQYPTDTIIPLGLPPALRHRLTPAEAAAVPPTIVFVNTVDSAEATRKLLSVALGNGSVAADGAVPASVPRVAALHKRVDPDARAKALRDFASGAVRVLVATNVASRGLDTLGAAHVIQAEFAQDVVSHLHRTGRTGRAGREGRVTNLLCRANLDLARAVIAAQAAGDSVEASFSRRRSFRRSVKRAAVTAAEEAAVMDVLQEEQTRLQGAA